MHKNKDFDQAEFIANELGFKYFIHDSVSSSHVDSGFKLGNAIISRYPISDHTSGLFFNPDVNMNWEDGTIVISHDKGFTKCNIDIDGELIEVTSLHLLPFRKFGIDLDSTLANKRLVDVQEKIRPSIEKWIIQGDFNIDSPTISEFLTDISKSSNVTEAEIISPTTPKGRKYDHILYEGLKITTFAIEPKVNTDHYPIASVFSV